MAQEEKYVWVVQAFSHTDVPLADRYELVEKTKSGVRVKIRGTTMVVRKAIGRFFRFEERDVKRFFEHYLRDRVNYHRRKAAECSKACRKVLDGEIPVDVIPGEAPFPITKSKRRPDDDS